MQHVKEQHDVAIKRETLVSSFSESESESNCGLGIQKPVSLPGRMTGPTRRSTKGGWTGQEDNLLLAAVQKFNGKNWKKIAESVPGRTDVQCLHRWQKVLNPNLIKGPWTKQEDDLIRELVMMKGKKRWSVIAKFLPGRIGKQCRERWHNHLNPDIKRTAWTEEEEFTLIKAHQIYGNRWAEIAKFLHGRSENSIKNHWNCSLKKKVNLNAYMCAPRQSCNFNAEGKMAIVKQSYEEKVNLDQGIEANLSFGTMNARENHTQSLDFETRIFVRNETDYDIESQSTAALNETSNESCEGAGKTSPMRYDANVTRVSIETSQSIDNKCPCPLCYKALQLKDMDILLLTGRLPSTNICTQNTSAPSSFYKSNYTERIFVNDTSPEDILRNAAKSYKNTPSIMRKERVREQNTRSKHLQKVDVRINSTKSPRRLDFSPAVQSDGRLTLLSPRSQEPGNPILPTESPGEMQQVSI